MGKKHQRKRRKDSKKNPPLSISPVHPPQIIVIPVVVLTANVGKPSDETALTRSDEININGIFVNIAGICISTFLSILAIIVTIAVAVLFSGGGG